MNNCQTGYYLITGFSFTNLSGNVEYIYFTDNSMFKPQYCVSNSGNCNGQVSFNLSNLVTDINNWLLHYGYGGNASLANNPPRIVISNSKVRFQELFIFCGSQSRDALAVNTSSIPFTATSVTINNSIGAPCDDGNPCTINDAWTADCNCIGIWQDTDGDGICDPEDPCPDMPNQFDFDGDGIPDCNDKLECNGVEIQFCEYLNKMAVCQTKLQKINLKGLQDT